MPLKPKSLFHDACSQIIKQVAIILTGYVAEFDAGNFSCQHEEMDTVRKLLAEYDNIARQGFAGGGLMRSWLRDVAELLPSLWD